MLALIVFTLSSLSMGICTLLDPDKTRLPLPLDPTQDMSSALKRKMVTLKNTVIILKLLTYKSYSEGHGHTFR